MTVDKQIIKVFIFSHGETRITAKLEGRCWEWETINGQRCSTDTDGKGLWVDGKQIIDRNTIWGQNITLQSNPQIVANLLLGIGAEVQEIPLEPPTHPDEDSKPKDELS